MARRRVIADVPAGWKDAVRGAAGGNMSRWVAGAIAEMLATGELCIAPPLNGAVADMAIYLPDHLYAELSRLVERGVYATLSDAVRGAIARRLGMCRRVVPYSLYSARGDAVWRPCGPVDFHDWAKTVEFVKCALRWLLRLARGRVVHFNMRQLCAALTGVYRGNCIATTYAAAVYEAVREVAGDCVVAERRKDAEGAKRHTLVLDVACLRGRVCGAGECG